MKAPIFKQSLVSTLWSNINANYELYMEGDFADFLKNPEFHGLVREIDGLYIREEDLINLIPTSGGNYDAHNANIIYSTFENMSPNQAYDERIWVAVTHTFGFEFTRKRWLNVNKSKEDNINSIEAHFFGRKGGSRGIHRNNAFSSLWWWAHLISRNSADVDYIKRLEVFTKYTDLRANIMERPSSSRTSQVFDAIINCVIKKTSAEPDTKFFTRKRTAGEIAPYRLWMMQIN